MIFINLFLSLVGLISSYDSVQLNTGVWLSGAAYCGKENYNTMKLGGPATGFIYKDTLYDVKTDLGNAKQCLLAIKKDLHYFKSTRKAACSVSVRPNLFISIKISSVGTDLNVSRRRLISTEAL